MSDEINETAVSGSDENAISEIDAARNRRRDFYNSLTSRLRNSRSENNSREIPDTDMRQLPGASGTTLAETLEHPAIAPEKGFVAEGATERQRALRDMAGAAGEKAAASNVGGKDGDEQLEDLDRVAPHEKPAAKAIRSLAPVKPMRAPSAAANDVEGDYGRQPEGLVTNWPDVIADLSCHIGQAVYEMETRDVSEIQGTAKKWIECLFDFKGEPLLAIAEPELVYSMCSMVDPQLRSLPANPVDAALLIEYLFGDRIDAIEAATGAAVTARHAALVDRVPAGKWFFVTVTHEKTAFEAAIQPGPECSKVLAEFVAAHALPGEKGVDLEMAVKIGPVMVEKSELEDLGTGDEIDCGINPTAEVSGLLERSDRKFWPITFTQNVARISGDLQGPLPLEPDAGHATVCLQIGTVTLARHERMRLASGMSLPVQRLGSDQTLIWIDNVKIGNGSMKNPSGSLVVEISQMVPQS